MYYISLICMNNINLICLCIIFVHVLHICNIIFNYVFFLRNLLSSACKNRCLSVVSLLSMFLYFFNLGRWVPPADIWVWFASVLFCVFWRRSIKKKMLGCAWLRCFFNLPCHLSRWLLVCGPSLSKWFHC